MSRRLPLLLTIAPLIVGLPTPGHAQSTQPPAPAAKADPIVAPIRRVVPRSTAKAATNRTIRQRCTRGKIHDATTGRCIAKPAARKR